MIRLESVGLRYGRATGAARRPPTLHGISLAVPQGGFCWLLGGSGAGKTSLLRLLSLAARPTEGRLNVLGTAIETARRRDLPPLRRRIGMIFQDFRLLPQLSAFDNVALPLRLAGRPEAQLRADVIDMLDWVAMTSRADARPEFLSGGERQRIAAARAVITRPALLLADEPTASLDDGQADRLMHMLRELNWLGTTVLVATHKTALVDRHPAPAWWLEGGRLAGTYG